MTGITDLNTLIATMEPALAPQRYVFASVPHPSAKMLETAKGMFVEKEGVTLILQDDVAQALEIQGDGPYACITLNVHSSLEAVGLTAAFAKSLGDANISANVVAGYYHDHIFVAERDALEAMNVLKVLSDSARSN